MPSKVLSKAELFYIEKHRHLPPEEIARELGLHRRTVEAALRKLPTPTEEAAAPAKARSDGFERQGRATVMTASRSQADDEAAGTSPFAENKEPKPYNKGFLDTVRKSVYVPDPSQPIR